MSQEAPPPGRSRWRGSPRLWLRWWAGLLASARDAWYSLCDWFRDSRDDSTRRHQIKRPELLIERLEERNHPDDLGSVLGISIVGVLLGTLPDPSTSVQVPTTPPVNDHDVAAFGRVLQATPLDANDHVFSSDDAAVRGAEGVRSETPMAGTYHPTGLDPLIATLLLDLDFDLLAGASATASGATTLAANGSGTESRRTSGDTSGDFPTGGDSGLAGSGGVVTPSGTSGAHDPFAWMNFAAVGAGLGEEVTPAGSHSPRTTMAWVQPEGSATAHGSATEGGQTGATTAAARDVEASGAGVNGTASPRRHGDDARRVEQDRGGVVPATLAPDFARVPVAFEQNVGQADPAVRFLSRGVGQTLFLTDRGAVLSLAGPRQGAAEAERSGEPATVVAQSRNDVLRLNFVGANATPRMVGQQELESKTNYLTGGNPAGWHTDVANYGAVVYENLYDGVDLVWHPSESSSRQFQFDWRVAPGQSHESIALELEGARSLRLDEDGGLIVGLPQGDVKLLTPVLYQEQGGQRQQVQGGYRLLEGNRVGFAVGDYDRSRELVVDPTISWSTYLGGTEKDHAQGVAVDAAGNVYVAGATMSVDFPTQGPIQTDQTGIDAFVFKLNGAGTALAYATYLGGAGTDEGYGLAVDPAGNAYVAGYTESADFPLQGAFDTTLSGGEAFVAKLAAAGNALVYSSYLGGSGNDRGYAIALDATGSAYVTGETTSNHLTFPLVNAVQTTPGGERDTFVTKVDSTGSTLVYSTFLGGNNNDYGREVAVTPTGEAVVVGYTSSNSFPVANALQSARAGEYDFFVTKFAASGASLVWSTYLGGTAREWEGHLALDAASNVYVAGQSYSTDFPVLNAYQGTLAGNHDAVLAKLSADGSTLVYATYLGGTVNDAANAVAVGADGSAWVAGYTNSTGFPTVAPVDSYSGYNDAFVSRFDPTGATLTFSTFLGGSDNDWGSSLALAPSGDVVAAGWTSSSNFPTQDPLDGTPNGTADVFVTKIQAAPTAALTTITSDTGSSASDRITSDTTLTLLGTATPSATVTLYLEGAGIIGSTTASAGGTFSYAYGATLAEKDHAFTAYATAAGVSGTWSQPLLVTVDTTAPTVTLTMDATTTDLSPAVRVVATDLVGLATATTVTLDIDSDNNGTWDSSQTATLTAGLALFAVAPAFGSTGTRKFRARVSDLAGNEGTSATQTVDIVATSNPWLVMNATLATDALQGDPTPTEGSLSVGHTLDLDQSPGSNGFGLVYTSRSASAEPIVAVQLTADNSQSLPSTVTATLVWDTSGTPTTYAYAFSTSGHDPGEVLTLALQGPAVSTTGAYNWTVYTSADYGTPVTSTLDGYSLVVARDASSYGSGWSLAGVDQLIDIAHSGSVPAGVLRVYGSGRWAFYAENVLGGYISPAGDNGTLEDLGSAGWRYLTPDGRIVYFNAAGRQSEAVSADGLNTVTFTYTGSDLTGIATPDGALTTLTLSSGKVQTLQTDSRTVTLGYTGTDLTTISNPDGGLHTLAYDGDHKLTSEQFGVTRGTYAYDAHGLLSGWTSGAGSDAVATSLTPMAALGLGSLHAGTRYAVVTDAAGSVWRSALDNAGRLLQSIAPNGAIQTYARDGNGWVTASTDALGRTTTATLDGDGYATRIDHPDGAYVEFAHESTFHAVTMVRDERGHSTTYIHDGGGHLLSATDALGRHTTMTYYVSNGLLKTVTDARNHITTYTYDSSRRLESTRYADGGIVTLTYDANGNVRTQTDQRNYTTTFTNDALGRVTRVDNPDGSFTTAVYDATGLMTSGTDRGGVVSSTTYNTRGQASALIDGVGLALQRSQLYQYDAVGRNSGTRDYAGNWSHVNYDVVGRAIGTIDAQGNTTENRYDLAGQQIQYVNELGQKVEQVYNVRGWVTQTIDALGQRTTSTYDEIGNRKVFQDANGNLVTTMYDELNRGYQVQTAANTFTTTTFDEVGNVETVEDPGNQIVVYSYDEVDQLKTVTNAENETVTYAYDLAGNQTTFTNARGKISATVYDSMNRVWATVTPDNERTTMVYATSGVVSEVLDALNQTTTYLYDTLNQVTGYVNALGQEATSILDALGRTVASIDATNKVSQFLYDMLGRSIGTVDGLGNTTRQDYDAAGRLIRSIDANGNATEYRYDANGQLRLTIDPNGGVVTQTYDANGNLETYTDPLGNTTTFVYDGLDREIERIDALGHSLTYAYDTRNRMTSQTDREGRRKDWTYDDVGRVLTETWINADTSTANVLTYTYDDNGNILTAADYNGTYTLAYDNQDRVESQAGLYGVTLTFDYDALGRRDWIEDSFGGVLSSTYDEAGRLEKRQFGGTGQATLTYERGYTDSGEMLFVKRYSDLTSSNLIGTSTYTYDAGHRLTFLQHKDGAGNNIAAYSMTFDASGRITEENRNGTSVTYTYDTRSQLTQAGADAYSYDANGNRTMTGYTTGTGNQLTNDGTFTYTYDDEGNVSTRSKGAGLEKWFYDYDHNNRLLSVRKTSDGSTNTLTVTYAYDVFGNRIKEDKWSSGPGLVTTKFVYVGQEVYLDLNNANAVQMRYIQGDQADEMLARIDGSNNVAWFLTDRLGSIRDITDGSGSVIDSITYDAYGKITSETNSANRGRYGAFGMWQDTGTGQLLTVWRWLDYVTGTWGSTDQIWFRAGDSNLYRYVGNNPTNGTDPSGLQKPDGLLKYPSDLLNKGFVKERYTLGGTEKIIVTPPLSLPMPSNPQIRTWNEWNTEKPAANFLWNAGVYIVSIPGNFVGGFWGEVVETWNRPIGHTFVDPVVGIWALASAVRNDGLTPTAQNVLAGIAQNPGDFAGRGVFWGGVFKLGKLAVKKAVGMLAPASGATQGQKVFTTLDRPLDLNRPGTGATNKMSGTLTAEGQGGTFVTTTDLSNPANLQLHIQNNVPKLHPEMKYVYEIEVPKGGLKTDLTELPPRPTNGNIHPNTPGVKITRMWEVKWTYDPAKGFDVPTLVEVPVPGR